MKKFFWVYIAVLLAAASGVKAQTFSSGDLQMPQKAAPAFKGLPAGGIAPAKAQKQPEETFETNEDIAKAFEQTKAEIKGEKEAPSADDPLAQISKALSTPSEDEIAAESTEEDKTQSEEDIFIPEGELYRLNTPTLDGSVRGGQAFVEMDDKGRMKKVTKIFLFYDKFKITNYLSGSASCNVRFNVLSNLDQKVNQLDVKLVWPGLTTTLSFSNVQPNTQTYYNYSLLGDGCYNMDKAPNIIVNRCRVKGMTAAECANKLLWLSK